MKIGRRSFLRWMAGLGLIGISSYGLLKTRNTTGSKRAMLPGYLAIISGMTETIIPQTDTPGAKAAGVPQIFIHLMDKCATDQEINNLIDGMQRTEQYTQRHYGRSFLSCGDPEREEILSYFEMNGQQTSMLGRIRRRLWGDNFISILKHYTAISYCTSHLGATQGLAYDPVPVHYVPVVKLKTGQKAWATR